MCERVLFPKLFGCGFTRSKQSIIQCTRDRCTVEGDGHAHTKGTRADVFRQTLSIRTNCGAPRRHLGLPGEADLSCHGATLQFVGLSPVVCGGHSSSAFHLRNQLGIAQEAVVIEEVAFNRSFRLGSTGRCVRPCVRLPVARFRSYCCRQVGLFFDSIA